MSEWSSYIQAFLSFLGVSIILVGIMALWELSQEVSYTVHGSNIASSEEFREGLNPLYTTGEYLTHKEMALAVYNEDIFPLCARAVYVEATPSSHGNLFLSNTQMMSYFNTNPDDIDLASDSFTVYMNTLKNSYKLDSKMRLFYSPSTIGVIGEADCYYFIDYEGVN